MAEVAAAREDSEAMERLVEHRSRVLTPRNLLAYFQVGARARARCVCVCVCV